LKPTDLTSGQSPEPGGWNRPVIPVKSMAESMAKLEQQGVRFRSRPIKGPGGQQALIEDPSGNPVELFQPRDPE
jgi:catechol 2,3-dioxygenase-like lactoylglutathione lyase family enzyme